VIVEARHQRQSVVLSCAFPASIPLILGIGTGAVQGRYQKTRLGAGCRFEKRVLICRSPSELRYGDGASHRLGAGMVPVYRFGGEGTHKDR